MDGTLALIEKIGGPAAAASVARWSEYRRHTDASSDPFATTAESRGWSPSPVKALRSDDTQTRGLVFFARMLDKIRLHAAGTLPADYNRGHGLDGRMCRFLRVDYADIVDRTLQGGTDPEILDWCYEHGRRRTEEEIFVFNAFMSKRGWRDDVSEWVRSEKARRGSTYRADLEALGLS